MKILAFCMDSTTYQAPSHEVLVMEEIANQGHDVTLVCERVPFGYDKEIPPNIKFYVMPINSQLSEEQISLLLSEQYDVCFSSSFPGTKYVNLIAQKQGIKSVSQILDVPVFRLHFKQWNDVWLRNIEELKKTDVIIANIEVTRTLLSQLSNGELYPKMKIVYYGIASGNADRIEQPKKENYISWVSGIRWYKGLDFLIYALACMKNPPKLKVVGVGDQTEWEVQGIPFRIVQLAKHLGVDVEFVGGVGDDEKFKIIKASRLAVMCDVSRSIATMFVLEAAYCGVPVITGDIPVCWDRYRDIPIYVNEVYDTGAWAGKIEEVWDNIDKYAKEVERKKQWILDNRSFKSQSVELLKVFEELVT